MKYLRPVIIYLLALCVCVSCTTTQPPVAHGVACHAKLFSIDDQFDGARRGVCRISDSGKAHLIIVPENDGYINDSPWYAFRITPTELTTPGTGIDITLDYRGGHHRYWPKISHDQKIWKPLDESQVKVNKSRRRAQLTVNLGNKPVWISGQEMVMPVHMETWAKELANDTGTRLAVLGKSTEQRDILLLESTADTDDVVLFVGRQHPPEVTGSYALRSFVTELFDNSSLANQFRQQYSIVVIPMVNPDGVIHGNWRHNVNGADLNRDWGPFSQAETQLIKNYLDELDKQGKRVRLFLDFHSTKRNVFYTQSDEDMTDPPNFATHWLNASRARLPGYAFEHAKRHNAGLPTSKNYMFTRYGIPAITFEIGDMTDQASAHSAARIFADEMMRILVNNDD